MVFLILKKFIIRLISAYQFCISPLLGNNCRFYPSCSAYTKQAFTSLSFFHALFLSVKRLLKCHPFHSGGYDPIPHRKLTNG